MENYKMVKCLLLLVVVTLLSACEKSDDQLTNPPEAFIKTPLNGFEIDIADTLSLEPQIIYDYNTTYQWYLNGVIIEGATKRIYTVIPKNQYGTFNYSFVVSNNLGIDTLNIPVAAVTKIDFEEFELEANSYSLGDGGLTVRESKIVDFPVYWDKTTGFWSGFAFSNKFSTTKDLDKNQYSVYNTYGGDEKSKIFLILSGEDEKETFMVFNDSKSHQLGKISFACNNYTYWAVKDGFESLQLSPYAIPLDYLAVRITGYDASGNTTAYGDYYISNFITDNPRNARILSNWEYVDLEDLGVVAKVGFKFHSSRADVNGVITPSFLCIDNIRVIK